MPAGDAGLPSSLDVVLPGSVWRSSSCSGIRACVPGDPRGVLASPGRRDGGPHDLRG